jgi:mannose-6-phosphate isomerase
VKPIRLAANRFPRFYRGGSAIDELRGTAPDAGGAFLPEDWVGSTTTAFGSDVDGLTRLEDGRTLREAVAADPEGFLGPEHAEAYGDDPALLVKLLHAGERLPVHCHPDRDFARRHLDWPWGKTEAWVIAGTEGPDPVVHLGFREPMDPRRLAELVDTQQVEPLLASLNAVPVAAGDTVLVPAGLPHAIGRGILLVELQEPTDLSVLVEWRRFGVNSGAEHLELGWSEALAAADRTPADPAAFTAAPGRLLPQAADPYFRAERLRNGAECEPSFAVLVALAGAATLHTERGGKLALIAGTTALVPYAAGTTILTGDLEAIRCLPPDPAAGEGDW